MANWQPIAIVHKWYMQAHAVELCELNRTLSSAIFPRSNLKVWNSKKTFFFLPCLHIMHDFNSQPDFGENKTRADFAQNLRPIIALSLLYHVLIAYAFGYVFFLSTCWPTRDHIATSTRNSNPVMTSFAGGAKGWSDHRFRVPPAYTSQLLTLHQYRANNQYRTANQI